MQIMILILIFQHQEIQKLSYNLAFNIIKSNMRRDQSTNSICSLFCGEFCTKLKQSTITRVNSTFTLKPQKISLKKVLQSELSCQNTKLKISNSNQIFAPTKCETNRSIQSQSDLIRKKESIQNQIYEVNKQIQILTVRQERKITQLQRIRRKLGRINTF